MMWGLFAVFAAVGVSVGWMGVNMIRDRQRPSDIAFGVLLIAGGVVIGLMGLPAVTT